LQCNPRFRKTALEDENRLDLFSIYFTLKEESLEDNKRVRNGLEKFLAVFCTLRVLQRENEGLWCTGF
jgi:hypothetical protein